VVTAEASWMALNNHGVVDFLRQAGAMVDHIRLADEGVRGNGHLVMLESNSGDVLDVLLRWVKAHSK